MANWAFRASHWAAKLAELHPGLGLRLAGPLGYHLGPHAGPRRCPPSESIQKIWKHLPPGEVQRLRREISRQEYRNRALRKIFKNRGASAVTSRYDIDATRLLELHERGEPVVVVTWHLGVSRANSLGLHSLGLPLVYATFAGPAGADNPKDLPYFELKGGVLFAGFLKRSLDCLRDGGVVGMSLDASFGHTEPMSFLGGTLAIPRGAAALARLSGAHVMPCTSRWSDRGCRGEVKLHPPLPAPDLDRGDRDAWERAMMQSCLHFFEDWLRAHPEVTRLKELRRYVRD